MSSITLEQFKPKIGKLKIKHPVTGETTFQLPNGEECEGILHIVGQYSDEFINASKIMANEFEIYSKSDNKDSALDTINNIKTEMLSKCILGWDDTGFFDTKYSPDEALDLLSQNNNMWLVDQVQKFTLVQANFFLTS